jgi:hypothetical protein
MNLVDVTEILTEAFTTGWASTTPIDLMNTIFTPPDDSWVRFRVDELVGVQQTLGAPGNRRFRRECIVRVDVFALVEGAVPGKKGGTKTALTLAERARRLFEGRSIAPAKFHGATIRGPRRDPKTPRWIMVPVTCPFYYHEVA